MSMLFAAVHESGPDAVDGSSTGTRVPWMWVLLKAPRFEGANHGKRERFCWWNNARSLVIAHFSRLEACRQSAESGIN
jgi:hypothetical protein